MRTPPEELHDDAVEALLDALREAGLTASRDRGADIVLRGPTGNPVTLEVKAISVGDATRVRDQMGRNAEEARAAGETPRIRVLVADQLSEDARDLLRGTDWGYLDRRGALWLRSPGLIVNDTSLRPLERRRPRSDAAVRGRVGLGVVLRLLMYPHSTSSIRYLASAVDASPSTVHDTVARPIGRASRR